MKKSLIVFSFLALVLVLAGCDKANQNQEQNQNQEAQKNQEQKSSMISSFEEAMGLGRKMRCTFRVKDQNENFESAGYVEGKKYRSESMVGEKKFISIFDGETFYSWNEGEETGFKMNQECANGLGEPNQNQEQNQEQQRVQAGDKSFQDAVDVQCEAVDSIDFSIPEDVEFTDQCEMLKNVQNQLKKMNIPNMSNMPQN